MLTAAFFGADFDQALGEEDEAGHLHPFGDNVAYHLAPFALRIHRQEQEGPANPGDHDEYQKRMPVQKIDPRGTLFSFDRPALGRSDLIQKFRPQNDDHRAAPIGNGIAKKRAHMSFWIEHSISDDPNNEQADRNHAQRMAVKKRVTISGHEDVSALCYLSLVNHHGAGFAISQSTSFHCSPVRTRLSFHDHISSTAK
jgi:hypothetical protein